MPLPGAASAVTVTETYVDGIGTMLAGTVTFTPSTRVFVSGTTISLDPVVARVVAGALLAPDGTSPLVLPATDDPDLTPPGWTWRVQEQVGSKSTKTRFVNLPATPSTAVLHTLADVEPAPPGFTRVLSVNDEFPDAFGNVVVEGGGGGGVPPSRTITTTGGIVGGGDLSANRSLSLTYGSAGSTVCQGNDARLSDARTPLAHQHPTGDVTGLDAALAAKADLVGGKVPAAQLPALAVTEFLGAVASQVAMLALVGQRGDWATRTDLGTNWQLIADDASQLSSWLEHTYPASPVSSVAGRTGAVTLTKTDVGLANVDNTTDANKPVSTATQTALDLKAPLASPTFTGTVAGISKTMVGLGNVDNTSDANKPVSTATQTALDVKATKPKFTTSTTTSGNIQLNTGTNIWGLLTGSPTLAIAAAAGDLIELSVQALRQANSNIFLDFCVIVSAAAVRYMANYTGTPAGEGNPALYHTALPATGGTWKWVAQSGDISGGNVTVGIAIRNTSGASSLLLASTDNPLTLQLENKGPST